MSELAGKDRRALRALGHHLRPIVQIGKDGITPAVVEAAERALADHELIKVKLLEAAPLERKDAARELAGATGAELAQVLGRTFLLFKANPEKPGIELPRKQASGSGLQASGKAPRDPGVSATRGLEPRAGSAGSGPRSGSGPQSGSRSGSGSRPAAGAGTTRMPARRHRPR